MTQQDEQLFAALEVRLQLLMDRNDALRKENRELHASLADCRTCLADREHELQEVSDAYRNLKTVHVLAAGGGDEIGDTKKQLRKLIGDIDQCIALLNA